MSRYPLALYGPRGWDDLADTTTVHDAAEEHAARARGYSMLHEPRGVVAPHPAEAAPVPKPAEPVLPPATAADAAAELEAALALAGGGSAAPVGEAALTTEDVVERLIRPALEAPQPFDWSRPWFAIKADLADRGFAGKTKADAVAWAQAHGIDAPAD